MEKKNQMRIKEWEKRTKEEVGFVGFFCVFYLLGLSESSRAGNGLRRRERKALGE